jgi:hypothetical protein
VEEQTEGESFIRRLRMFKKKKMEKALKALFGLYADEYAEEEELTDKEVGEQVSRGSVFGFPIDSICQGLRDEAVTPYDFRYSREDAPVDPGYCGRELFGERAVKIAETTDTSTLAEMSYLETYEIWMTEKGKLFSVECRGIYGDEATDTDGVTIEYRRILGRIRRPEDCMVPMEEITDHFEHIMGHCYEYDRIQYAL